MIIRRFLILSFLLAAASGIYIAASEQQQAQAKGCNAACVDHHAKLVKCIKGNRESCCEYYGGTLKRYWQTIYIYVKRSHKTAYWDTVTVHGQLQLVKKYRTTYYTVKEAHRYHREVCTRRDYDATDLYCSGKGKYSKLCKVMTA